MIKLKSSTSAIKLNSALQFDSSRSVSFSNSVIELLQSLIVVSYVSLVVFLVVELHDIAANRRLQSAIIVCKIWKRECLQSTQLLWKC
ncbi:hypothetical protein Hanom_Chr08g00710131 [Helianthus anomalus]